MIVQIGQKIGPYRVVRPLGRGGMGEVYEVVHEQLQASYAMKIFVVESGNVALLRDRFLAEARVMNRLKDPHIVSVYDLGVENDRPYFVMDLMVDSNGEPATLAAATEKGGISERQIYEWYLDLRKALKTIHEAGIVHRDIKPVNVLLDSKGRALLSDFGVARYEGEFKRALSLDNTVVTGQNSLERPVFGTTNYLAPEVCKGEPATPASDLYSLGVLTLKLLSGFNYQLGVNLSLMLRPFSPCWSDVLPILLSEDPKQRNKASIAPFRQESQYFSKRMKCAASIGTILLLGSLVYYAIPVVTNAYAEYQLSCVKKERCTFFDTAFSVPEITALDIRKKNK